MHRQLLEVGLAVFLVAVAPASKSGQRVNTPDAGPRLGHLGLRDAERLFGERNHELRLAQRAAEGAQADVFTASARPNPSLSVATSQAGSRTGIGAGGPLDKRIDTVIGISQLFERGDKRALRTDAAQFVAQAVRNESADIERRQRIALHGAYFQLVLAQDKARITGETAALFASTLEAAELRLKAGDIAANDVARIRVDALRSQNDDRAAKAEQATAQLALAYLIGAGSEARQIHAADGWPDVATSARVVDFEEALAGRADVRAARNRVAAAGKNRELARALRTRDVTAGVQYERFPGDAGNNSYGVFVSMPLFTGNYYNGEIRRAEAEFDAAREELARVRAAAVGEIAKARTDLESAADRVGRFRETLLVAAEKAAQGAEFAYGRGAIGVMDLLDARRQLYGARLEYVAALADYAKAAAAWRASIAPSAVKSAPTSDPRFEYTP